MITRQTLRRTRFPRRNITMPTEDLDDDYVANLLKNDAKTSSKKYTMVGLEAFLPKRFAFSRLFYIQPAY